MKVRWRQHEMVLATLVATVALKVYAWNLYNLSAEMIEKLYAAPFIENHVSFNLYRNVLLPDIGSSLLVYLIYLFFNLVTIKHFFGSSKIEKGTLKVALSLKKISILGIAGSVLTKYLWFAIQVGLIIVLLGVGFNAAIYFENECYFSYPGFTFFPVNGYHPQPMMVLTDAFIGASTLVVLYIAYACIREIVIHFIEASGSRRAYLTLIANQVTLMLTIYFSVTPVVLQSGNAAFYVIYFLVIPEILLIFLINLYWFFPWKGEASFLSTPVITRLLLITFACSLPFIFLQSSHNEGGAPFLLGGWIVQWFVITPVSWLVYEQKKDKILQVMGTQKALVKSNTDLQFLRSQINPHFLFNVLNTLYGTALQERAERTAEGIQRLGDMMRFMLHENNLDFIPMDKEISYLKNYISLQKMRTQSSAAIQIEDSIHEQNCDHKIAPMLLIPLVENAFKHGISLNEKSWIKINLDCDEKSITFEVRNSMHPTRDNDPEKERSGIGFKNVMKRLKLIYPGKHQIKVNGDGKEFFVQLTIHP